MQGDSQGGPVQLAGEGLLAGSKFWRDQLQLLQSRSGAVLVRDGSIIRRMSCAVRPPLALSYVCSRLKGCCSVCGSLWPRQRVELAQPSCI